MHRVDEISKTFLGDVEFELSIKTNSNHFKAFVITKWDFMDLKSLDSKIEVVE